MTLKKFVEKIKAKGTSQMLFFAMNQTEAAHLCAEIEKLDKVIADVRTLEQELAAHKANSERIVFLQRKTRYAKPVQGFHQGAHQITITCSHPDTVPADFLQAVDEAMAREKGTP